MIDLYIIFVLLHLGVTAFIRGLYFGKDYIYDFRTANPLTIGLIFAQVFIILFIIRSISLYFPERIAKYLKIRYLMEQWGNINKYILFIIYTCLVVLPIISYYKFGVSHSYSGGKAIRFIHFYGKHHEKCGFWREWEQDGSRKEEGGYGRDRNPLKFLVGTRGFEPLTPTASR